MIKDNREHWADELDRPSDRPYFGKEESRLFGLSKRFGNRFEQLLDREMGAESVSTAEQADYDPRLTRNDRFPDEYLVAQPELPNQPERKAAYDTVDRIRRDEITSVVGSGAVGAAVGGGIAAGGAYLAGAPVLQSTVLGGLGVVSGVQIGALTGLGLYGLGKYHQHLSNQSHEEHGILRTMTVDAAKGLVFGIPKTIGYMFGRAFGGRR